MALPLLGGVIFGVLGKVAMSARFLDRVDDLGPLQLEALHVLGQLAMAFRQHRHLVACHLQSPLAKTRPGAGLKGRRIVGRIV